MPELPHPGDSQKVELLGRNRLIDELLRDNLEVAVPVRDHGIDLIAYADTAVAAYVARPIQMKAAWTQGFAVDRKYEKFPGLILAYVWNLSDPAKAVTFAMSYADACGIADAMGWTRTASWQRGGYSTSKPSAKLLNFLQGHQVKTGTWRQLITSLGSNSGL